MKIIRDDLSLCDDCMMVRETDDLSIFDYQMNGRSDGEIAKRDARIAEIYAGLARLGPNLVPAWDSESGRGIDEFSRRPCDCCGTRLAGSRREYAILG